MGSSVRRALFTWIGLVLVRRKLQRRGGAGAAVGLVALDLFGPAVFRARRLAVWALALTVVGAIAAGVVWWWLRSRRTASGPAPGAPPPAPEPEATSPAGGA
jgi:hypothetical protein